MLELFTLSVFFTYFLVFCRVGGAVLMMPGFSEAYVSPRARLAFALALTVAVAPIIQSTLPVMPNSVMELGLLIAREVMVGILIGSIAKIVLSALHVAGSFMSYQSGLAAGTLFDPAMNTQTALIGAVLTFTAIFLLFITNMHHVFLKGVVDSYSLFPIDKPLPIDAMTEVVARTFSDAFAVGIKMAIPHAIISLVLYLGAGLMGRLMPQMQVFFVLMPVQIWLGFFVLMAIFSVVMLWFIEYYQEVMQHFLDRV